MRVHYSTTTAATNRTTWLIRVTEHGEKKDLIDIILETHSKFETWNDLASAGVTIEINSLLHLNNPPAMSETAYIHLCTLVSIIGIKDIRSVTELKGQTYRILGRI